jgi:hypothetical protein
MSPEKSSQRGAAPDGGIGSFIKGLLGTTTAAIWAFLNAAATKAQARFGGAVVTFSKATAASLMALNAGLSELGQAVRRNAVDGKRYTRQYWQRQMNRAVDHAKIGVVFPPGVFGWIVAGLFGRANNPRTNIRLQVKVAAKADDKHDIALIMQRVNALHRIIEAEAASGWRTGYPDRASEISKLADFIVNRDPLVKNIIGRVVAGALDLASVDDPFARLLLGKLIQLAIEKLGTDRLAGGMLSDLIGTLMANPHARNLHDVIADIGSRIGAQEAQWAQFYANGGSQVEQAGQEWRDITGIGANLALVAFFGLAVAEPTAWAKDVQGTIGTVAGDLITGVADLITRG